MDSVSLLLSYPRQKQKWLTFAQCRLLLRCCSCYTIPFTPSSHFFTYSLDFATDIQYTACFMLMSFCEKRRQIRKQWVEGGHNKIVKVASCDRQNQEYSKIIIYFEQLKGVIRSLENWRPPTSPNRVQRQITSS